MNYSRLGIEEKVKIDKTAISNERLDLFAKEIAATLNDLYPKASSNAAASETGFEHETETRVRFVVSRLDGTDWEASHRIKVSFLADPWFRTAGIDGMFDPWAHEAIVVSTLTPAEKPFVVAHELAHAWGYPDEGEANFIAALATTLSSDPRLEYSGWLNLWLYVRTPELDSALESGPREDIQRIIERFRRDEIRWLGEMQAGILDWFLKANDRPQGVRSYASVIVSMAGSRAEWDRFR